VKFVVWRILLEKSFAAKRKMAGAISLWRSHLFSSLPLF
jgi:hypothetical protein